MDKSCMNCANRTAAEDVKTGRRRYMCGLNGASVNRRMCCGEWTAARRFAFGTGGIRHNKIG